MLTPPPAVVDSTGKLGLWDMKNVKKIFCFLCMDFTNVFLFMILYKRKNLPQKNEIIAMRKAKQKIKA